MEGKKIIEQARKQVAGLSGIINHFRDMDQCKYALSPLPKQNRNVSCAEGCAYDIISHRDLAFLLTPLKVETLPS
jgi:hypothetical protein